MMCFDMLILSYKMETIYISSILHLIICNTEKTMYHTDGIIIILSL